MLRRWEGLIVLAFAGCYFAVTQFSTPNLVEGDSSFHIKLAYLMRTEGLVTHRNWLTFTILHDRYLDHHFLYHVLLIPFTCFDLRLGGKLAPVVFSTAMVMVFYGLLRRLRTPWPLLWIAALFSCSFPFLWRMSMARSQNVSLILQLTTVGLLLAGRYRWIFVVGFLYVWLYTSASFFVPLFALLYVCATWLVDRELRLAPLLAALGGWVAGYVVNPFFPENVRFGLRDMAHKLHAEYSVRVGNEWYGYDSDFLLASCSLTFVALFVGVVLVALASRKAHRDAVFTFLLAGVFAAAALKARRFVEYWPPYAIMFCALAARDFFAPNSHQGGAKHFRYRKPLMVLLVGGLGFFFVRTYESLVLDLVEQSANIERYGPAARWLDVHAADGETIFNADWDDFPEFFFHNSNNAFVVGLDPAYMEMSNHDLYLRWTRITEGEVNNPSQIIRSQFHARYVFTNNDQEAFIQSLKQDRNAREVFRDRICSVYEVRQEENPRK